jgi:uncharacterized membrane protein
LKIRALVDLLIIDVLTILLMVVITLTQSNIARIVLGLPFLLFSPGYMLIAALFVNNTIMNTFRRTALSFGLSVAVIVLIGLGLNFTPWGIGLVPVLYSISGFIIIMSIIALVRRAELLKETKITQELQLSVSGWRGSPFQKSLIIILFLAILGAVGTLGYSLVIPKTGEIFTEFYILGNEGIAQNYPSEFVMAKGETTAVSYDGGKTMIPSNLGQVTIGFINREQHVTSYRLVVKIDGQPVTINYDGKTLSRLDGIQLQPNEKWERQIGFAPQHLGDNQMVEFFLLRDESSSTEETLHLWINVKSPY